MGSRVSLLVPISGSQFLRIAKKQSGYGSEEREREETELKVLKNLPICTPPAPIPAPPVQLSITGGNCERSSDGSDLKAPGNDNQRTSSATSPERPDLVSATQKVGGLAAQVENQSGLKKPREVTRCSESGCKKKIGLIGRVWCGVVWCGVGWGGWRRILI
ncbi:zinc finger A20 and AN1 domain-containing stress-associated protein 5-like [Abeliophyllum distichum]|uniref:Zinc finger A20 and AN1 domain-containing stress-associated protein 5-like n=1 Tax=Abeliophyllum distichum TaxID=126358 RepID=A0ABD1VBL2_9LAMI